MSRWHRVVKGAHPIEEGEPARIVFNIRSGCIKLAKLLPDGRQFVTRFAGPGELVAFPADDRYDVTAIAVEDSDICQMSRAAFDRLVRERPLAMAHTLADSRRSLRQAEDRMLLLGRKHALERVAAFLIERLDEAAPGTVSRVGPAGIHLPMTRQDIADYLGLTLETVSRCLTQLRRRGLIELPAVDRVTVPRRDALTRIADGYDAGSSLAVRERGTSGGGARA